ncbi:hypothetical protein [Stigmatella hybrida]|uniref:hypothetical protein n=1 Tax=Stigmatella hybrida TaxID=394097 RepID=UPI001CDAB9AB|nr:hypothetical protein [Stigmatella hybrida]
MFKPSDPYTYMLNGPLQNGGGPALGLFTALYQVTHYDDVQLSSGTVQAGVANDGVRKYILSVTQRITIYNPSGMTLSPESDVSSYLNYPALLNTLVELPSQKNIQVQLVGYSPHTVNTQVQVSGTLGSSSGQTTSSSTSNTVGSSMAQTNTFGVSMGVSGDGPNFGASAEQSITTTTEQSSTVARDTGRSATQESSSSAYMSMKDWGAYSLINPVTNCPSWTFGQEYPWDTIQCRKTTQEPNPYNPAQVLMVVPSTMMVRLYDGVSLYPPSHLSMFGINFVMTAQWLVTVDNTVADSISFDHTINYFTASHVLKGDNDNKPVSVYLDKSPILLSLHGTDSISTTLDLGVMGLDPVGDPSAPTVVGFVPAKFICLPAPAASGEQPVPFRIFSTTNTLLAFDTTTYPANCTAGAGFSPGDTALTATLAGNCTSLTFTLLFKVIDATTDYTLNLKHWKTTPTNLMLTIVVNGDTTLTKYVDALEAEGGENNLLSIALRNLDFASADFADMLTLGLNSIAITVAPADGTSSAGYALRAISIEPS